MTDGMHARRCEEFADDLAELALGILTGRERAAALSHVESCPRCAHELEELSRAADAVVRVAPDLEPPVGFEVRLFSAMGVAPVADRRWSRPSRRTRWLLAAAAAVVALVTGLSVGWATSTGRHGPARVSSATPLASANLVENGKRVGHVDAYGGAHPWMSMTLADSAAMGRVTCAVITDEGVTRLVGAFTVKEGYGAWAATLPVSPRDVRTAEVLGPNGAVIATAPLG
jgi:hypothetical protein